MCLILVCSVFIKLAVISSSISARKSIFSPESKSKTIRGNLIFALFFLDLRNNKVTLIMDVSLFGCLPGSPKFDLVCYPPPIHS